uniref:cardiotrophin-1-like n=1 Tax=Pristiophorus japonicus TaxID=55135 RepID=UPI00398F0641
MENAQGAVMEPARVTIERTYSLSLWLADESTSLLQLYTDLQGFTDPPPGLPACQLQLPGPPGEDWGRARRLKHHRDDCHVLADHLRRLLDEQRELNQTQHHLHRQLEFTITSLEGLAVNLGLILASLGEGEGQGQGEGEGQEGGEELDHGPPSQPPHWEAKVKGYHVIAHYGNLIGRTVGDLEQLRDSMEPEA